MVSLKVVETAPSADGDDNVLIDSVGVTPLAMARGGLSSVVAGMAILAIAEVVSLAEFAGVASQQMTQRITKTIARLLHPLLGWRSRPLLGWRLRPTLLGWRSRPLLGRCPWPLLRWRPHPIRWRRHALLVCAAHIVLMIVWYWMIM